MSLIQQIEQDAQTAFKERQEKELQVLRLLKAKLQNQAIEMKLPKDVKTRCSASLPDDEVIKILKTEIKSRKDAIQIYQEKELADLAANEQAEIVILEKYLPAQIGEDKVRQKVAQVVADLGEAANFGAVMKQVMAEFGAQADGQMVSKIVKELLG